MRTNKKNLLDTNILIEFLEETPSVVEHVLKVGSRQCCMSVVSLHELFYGAYLAKEKKKEYYDNEYFAVLPINANGESYGKIKYALRKIGKPVDEFDMLIASQAVSEGLTVVTDNIKHFENMPDVKVANWMER